MRRIVIFIEIYRYMTQDRSRRKFLFNSVKYGLSIPILTNSLLSCHSDLSDNATKPNLKILILGGTSFLGPHIIAAAMKNGHDISTFTRGKSKPTVHQSLFKDVESLIGDRADNLESLKGRKWDVVIDNSGHDVQWAKDSSALLKDQVDTYLFTSSTGVYYPYLSENIKESQPTLTEEPKGMTDEEVKLEYWYGVMKTNSENAVIREFGKDRSLIIRPTYMIGPADKSNRFIHWPIRLSQGGEILIPGKPTDPVQFIDVRDIADWMIKLIERKATGTYNAVGPELSMDMNSFIQQASQAFGVSSTFINVDDYEFLLQNKIAHAVPWIMPVGNNRGSALISNQKAIQNGLTCRNIKDSIEDTYDWWYSDALTDEYRNKVEANPENVIQREKSIIEDWKSLNKKG